MPQCQQVKDDDARTQHEDQAEEGHQHFVDAHGREDVTTKPVQPQRAVMEDLYGAADGEGEGHAQYTDEDQPEGQSPQALIKILLPLE